MVDAQSQSSHLALRSEVTRALDGELTGWFPRCVDPDGGFFATFDERWNHLDDDTRTSVFQARQTWTAATIARRRPDPRVDYAGIARHGVAYLADVMWDAQHGGFHSRIDPATREPDPSAPKHAYYQSFGLYAAAAAYEATRDEAALKLAIATFEWLDARGHDPIDGGYVEQFEIDGTPVRAGPQGVSDLIGTPIGQRSTNAHIHLLESFTELYDVWPDPTLRARLIELFELVRDRLPDAHGFLPPTFASGWRATGDASSYGHDVEAIFLLGEAARALVREDEPATLSLGHRVWSHALAHGEDAAHGGFFNEGVAGAPARDRRKIWWVQAEAVQSALWMHAATGEACYFDAFQRLWAFARDRMIDGQHGGWFAEVSEDGAMRVDAKKGHIWKGAYHTGRALLNVARMLTEVSVRNS